MMMMAAAGGVPMRPSQRAMQSNSLSQHPEMDGDDDDMMDGHSHHDAPDRSVQPESMMPQRSYDWSADSSDGVVRMS
jgi:hypothetical protein